MIEAFKHLLNKREQAQQIKLINKSANEAQQVNQITLGTHHSSRLFSTTCFTLRSYSALLSWKSRAASLFAGEAGFGSHSSDLIEVRMAHTSQTGLHWSIRMSRHILPSLQTLGWNISVLKDTFGGLEGQVSANSSFNSKIPLSQGVFSGPSMMASHRNKFSSSGVALMPLSSSFSIFWRSLSSLRVAGLVIFFSNFYNFHSTPIPFKANHWPPHRQLALETIRQFYCSVLMGDNQVVALTLFQSGLNLRNMISLDDQIKKDRERDRHQRGSHRRGRASQQQQDSTRYKHHARRDNRQSEMIDEGSEHRGGRGHSRQQPRVFLKINNLHYSVTKQQLLEICQSIGKVKSCRILWDKSGRSNQKATVEYFERSDTEKAVGELRGRVIEEQAIETELEEQSRMPPKRHEIRRTYHNNRFRKNFQQKS